MHRRDLLRHIRNKHSDGRSLLKRRAAVVDDDGVKKMVKLSPPSPMVIPDDPEIKVFVLLFATTF